ncbi:MAG: helix-turn-helix domain-containing protein [Calditrichaceae bacterium]|nr:helix-turn-helix domain-containing protein [Calditrichia bacterium]NUQ41708.1 helix-turn-helix domain-containing protein [Calditrichaceae bacterium]
MDNPREGKNPVNINPENLRFIMGFKLKRFRLEKGLSLSELAEKTNLSVSYLSEIEKGKKYPKPEKILQLAQSLGVPFDDLVSLQVSREADLLPVILSSPVIKEFPFRMYGVSPQDLLALITGDTEKAGALIRTFLEIGRDYDMRVEHLLFAALRSYQQMHLNYFEEIENAAAEFAAGNGWTNNPAIPAESLRHFLEEQHRCRIDEDTLQNYPELQEVRSVWIDGKTPKLLIKSALLPAQKAFIFAREIGYRCLELKERTPVFPSAAMGSFEQLLNDFKASYFAGALLLNRDLLCRDFETFFKRHRWDGSAFLALIERYGVTPKTFLYRLSQLLPQFFGLRDIFFFRINNPAGGERYHLVRMFNMSRMAIPNGIGMREHYCRRWMAIKLLKNLGEQRSNPPNTTLIAAQRSRFLDSGVEVFSITLAGSSPLEKGVNLSGTVSFIVNEHFKKTVGFWDDPAIPRAEVNETCERCGLSEEACRDRAVPPSIHQKQQEQKNRDKILNQLIQNLKQS